MSTQAGWFDRYFLRPNDPRPLALVRITMAIQGLASVAQYSFLRFADAPSHVASIPPELTEPVSFSWPLFIGGPPTDTTITLLKCVLALGLFVMLLGYKTRPVTIATCILWLSWAGMQQSYGRLTALSSCYHVLFLICATSRWGDAYSIDAWLAGRTPPPSWRYGFTLSVIYFELGVIYLATAIAKLRFTADWLVGDHLRTNIIDLAYFSQVFGNGDQFVPAATPSSAIPLAPFVIAHPAIARLLSIGSVGFETTFLLSFFLPRLRPLFLAGGLLFHFSIFLTVGIRPLVMLPMYVAGIGAAVWQRRIAAQARGAA